MSLYLIDPIAITCCVNFGARKFTKFMAKYEPVFVDPIAITSCINFGARKFTKFMTKYEPVFN